MDLNHYNANEFRNGKHYLIFGLSKLKVNYRLQKISKVADPLETKTWSTPWRPAHDGRGGAKHSPLFTDHSIFYDITLLFITFRANYTFIYVSKHMMIIIISISLHALRSRISNI